MALANQQAQVVCPDGGIPNALGNCPIIQPTDYVNSPADSSSEQTCAEQGLVQCATGGCASTIEECESIYDDYNQSMNITAEGEFIDNLATEENEALRDIYEGIGGAGWTGLSFEDWSAQYGNEFPVWEGSLEQEQYQLVQAQMGLLGAETENVKEAFKLGGEQMRYKSSAELESIGQAREGVIRQGGGLQSGQREEKIESAYDQVLKGFDFDVRSHELSYEQDLIGLEGRKLGYELDLSTTVSDFQDKMWNLIAAKQDMQKGDDSSGCGPGEYEDEFGECVLNSEFFHSGCNEEQLQTGWTENSAGQCVSPDGDVTDENEWVASEQSYTVDGEICNCSTDISGASSCFDTNGNSCNPVWAYTDPNFCNPQLPSDHPAGCGGDGDGDYYDDDGPGLGDDWLCNNSPGCCTNGVKDCEKCPEECGEGEAGGTEDPGPCPGGCDNYDCPEDQNPGCGDTGCVCYPNPFN